MRIADMISILEMRISQIDRLSQEGRLDGAAKEVLETAFWARSVLDIIGKLGLRKYGHTLKTRIRIVEGRGSQGKGETIQLEKSLSMMIHSRLFAFYRSDTDRSNCLMVVNDRSVETHVYYSDFVESLKSLVLSQRLVTLASCGVIERDLDRASLDLWRNGSDIHLATENMMSLLIFQLKPNTRLKLKIMQEIFGISDPPTTALSDLYFYPSSFRPDKTIVIGFGPPWEEGMDVFSPPFEFKKLADLIRAFYAAP